MRTGEFRRQLIGEMRRVTLLGWEFDTRIVRTTKVWGLGIAIEVASWNDAYPWVIAVLTIGPYLLKVDAVRPDAIALQMRAEAKQDPDYWFKTTHGHDRSTG